jgi:murein DD-endopeptidase MepM/ murein hydrolase activator NlpD
MKKKSCKYIPRSWITLGIVFLLLSACSPESPESCPSDTPIGLLDAGEIASDENLPFRFPLDESEIDRNLYFGWFGVSNECPPGKTDCYEYPVLQFHAAEDYKRPAGTPVYAMADGRISFSGPAAGYGWLIIIDHPQANLYSLYGHLSPSRWKQGSGVDVKRGDLIAYLGDSYENGGSAKNPVETHLHFGIRAGQMADFPGKGEWRFMAGWIRLCPQDLGWLQPSLVITSQEIPVEGYPQPEVNFLTRWGVEMVLTGAYGLGGTIMLIMGIRKKSNVAMLFPGPLLTLAGVVFLNNRIVSTYALLGVGVAVMAVGVYAFMRQSKQQGQS